MSLDSKINFTEIDNNLPKIKLYYKDNQESLNKIKITLLNISNSYESKYGKELALSSMDDIRNFPKVLENQKEFIRILELNKNKYSRVADETTRIFESLEKLD